MAQRHYVVNDIDNLPCVMAEITRHFVSNYQTDSLYDIITIAREVMEGNETKFKWFLRHSGTHLECYAGLPTIELYKQSYNEYAIYDISVTPEEITFDFAESAGMEV